MPSRTIVTSVGHPNIDSESGTIRDLALIAEGEIKWGQGFVDTASLQSYLEAAGVFGEYGVPIAFNPDGFNHGPGGLAGNLRELHIGKTDDGINALLGTFQVVDGYPDRTYFFNALKSNPVAIGLSVETWEHQDTVNGTPRTRCDELMCAKFVLTPAATRGMFQAGGKKTVDATSIRKQSHYYLAQPATHKPYHYKRK